MVMVFQSSRANREANKNGLHLDICNAAPLLWQCTRNEKTSHDKTTRRGDLLLIIIRGGGAYITDYTNMLQRIYKKTISLK